MGECEHGKQGRVGSPACGAPEAVLAAGVLRASPGRAIPLLPWREDFLLQTPEAAQGTEQGQTQGPCCSSWGKAEGLRGACKPLDLPSAQPSSSLGSVRAEEGSGGVGGGRGDPPAALPQGHAQGVQTCWPSCRPSHRPEDRGSLHLVSL